MRLLRLAALPLLSAFALSTAACSLDGSDDAEPSSPSANEDNTPSSGPDANQGQSGNAPGSISFTPSPGAPAPPASSPAAPTPAQPTNVPGAAPNLRLEGTPDNLGFYRQHTGTVDYLIRLPKGYNAATPTPYPMFIALHGCGDSAANFAQWAAAPPNTRANLGYIAVSVGGRDGACWDVNQDGAKIDSVWQHARARVYAHDQKIFVGGYSSGGVLAYKYGLDRADKLAGILIQNSGLYAVAGANNVMNTLQAADRKISVAHMANRGDTVFPLSEVQKDWQKMQNLGFPLSSSVLEGTHDGSANAWEQLVTKVTTWKRD